MNDRLDLSAHRRRSQQEQQRERTRDSGDSNVGCHGRDPQHIGDEGALQFIDGHAGTLGGALEWFVRQPGRATAWRRRMDLEYRYPHFKRTLSIEDWHSRARADAAGEATPPDSDCSTTGQQEGAGTKASSSW